jgi:thymidylate synthase
MPNPILMEFTRYFGRPRLQLTLSADQQTIREVIVERGAPCGSSQYAAKRIAGMKVNDIVPQGGLICLHYPCLASMQPKTTEQGVETLMHTSGIIYNQSLQDAIDQLDRDVN